MQPVPDEAGVSEDRLHPVVRKMTRVTIDRRNMGKSCYLRTHGSRNPLLGRGGVDATLRKGREASLLERTGWCWSRNSGQHHPVCAIWWLRIFFLIAQPPLLG